MSYLRTDFYNPAKRRRDTEKNQTRTDTKRRPRTRLLPHRLPGQLENFLRSAKRYLFGVRHRCNLLQVLSRRHLVYEIYLICGCLGLAACVLPEHHLRNGLRNRPVTPDSNFGQQLLRADGPRGAHYQTVPDLLLHDVHSSVTVYLRTVDTRGQRYDLRKYVAVADHPSSSPAAAVYLRPVLIPNGYTDHGRWKRPHTFKTRLHHSPRSQSFHSVSHSRGFTRRRFSFAYPNKTVRRPRFHNNRRRSGPEPRRPGTYNNRYALNRTVLQAL